MMTRLLRQFIHASSAIALLLVTMSASADEVIVFNLDAKRGELNDYLDKTKWNVVMAWTTYCEICREQYPMLSELHGKYADSKAVVLGISLDGYREAEKIREYRDKYAHKFPSIITSSTQFGSFYKRATGEDFTGTPTYLLIDKDGALRAYLDGATTLAVFEHIITK